MSVRVAPKTRSCIPIGGGEGVLRPLKTAEGLARDVVHDIVSRGLQPGDRLPSESAMLAEYGVSRESVREGLRLLEVQGLLTLRRGPGGGPVVGNVDPANLGRISTLYYHLAGATYAELFDAWVMAEGELAERAARNADRDRVREVMQPYIADDAGLDGEVEAFVQGAARFHAEVAGLAQNRVLELVLQTMGQIVTHHVIVNADPRDVTEAVHDDHQAIARAVGRGQAAKARQLMESHIHRISEFFGHQMGDQLTGFIEWR
jgi:GntR family transcriptional repressor for pyruvate dehydrogenase complex